MNNLKYHYLNKKIIEVKLKEKIDLQNEDGITVLKSKGNNLKVEINSEKKTMADVIKLIDTDKILDINISNIPLEDIITSIYTGAKIEI